MRSFSTYRQRVGYVRNRELYYLQIVVGSMRNKYWNDQINWVFMIDSLDRMIIMNQTERRGVP